MKGTILWNIWALIAGFTIYFLLSFAQGEPWPVILHSLAAGGTFFLLTYIVRILLAQAFPDRMADLIMTKQAGSDDSHASASPASESLSEPEIEKKAVSDSPKEMGSEDTAKIIRQMLNE